MICYVSARVVTDVVHVNSDCGPERFVFKNDITIDEVHHRLESRWGVGETEIHHGRFKKPVSGFEGCLVFVPFADTDVIVSPSYIEFCVDVCVAQIAYKIGDEGKGVLIADCYCIDLSIVLNRSEFSILFANEEKG